MRNLCVAAALVVAACAGQKEVVKPAPRAGPPPPPMKLIEVPAAVTYKEARELIAAGDLPAAKLKLEAYLAREPKSAAAWFDLGYLAGKSGDAEGAAKAYRKALANEPAHLGAAVNLARILKAQDQAADAERVCRAALEKRPDDPLLLDTLASLLRAQHKLDDAAAAVRKVLARHPRDADAYKELAAIEADRGHVRLAESALTNARKLDDKDAGIVNSLGLLAMRRDDAAAARAYFEEATKLAPSLAAPWANLGAIALSYRDYAAAESAYAQAVAADGARWDTRLAHAWALEGLRKPKEARAEFEKVLALKAGQEDALYGRAVALKSEGDLPAALEAFKAYALAPKASRLKDAQSQMASIELRLKNPPQAPKPAVKERPATGSGDVDLSRLPVGTDTGPASQLPAEAAPDAAPQPGAPAKEKEKLREKDPGLQKQPAPVQANVQR